MGFIDWNAPNAPCVDCERKGCGAYHDQCEKFKQYKEEVKAYRKHVDADPYKGDDVAGRRQRRYKPLPNSAIKTHKRREDVERWD